MKFLNYNIDTYLKDLEELGIEETWTNILEAKINGEAENEFLKIENFGELYEIGLAKIDKVSKKEQGKYYTPNDVSNVMVKWFDQLSGDNICDVCCGTGNLILAFLELKDISYINRLLNQKRIFLYDTDKLALKICKYSIAIKYGKEYLDNINCIDTDFLNKEVKLPENARVICNPPYYKITNIKDSWIKTNILVKTKEFYSAIMEKILDQSVSSVIITPYSFIGSNKFYPLREKLNNHNGSIFCFDNVPGNIFNGKKHGIFNTNTSNAVRAAITVTQNTSDVKGYRVSPLIRFKNEEREQLLINEVLEKTLSSEFQTVDSINKSYYKCFRELEDLFENWKNKSNKKISDMCSAGEFKLCLPNACRYFTVATIKDLARAGKYYLTFDNEDDMNLVYCLANSSFCYWHWRLYDGGINYHINLLKQIPVFFDSMPVEDKKQLIKIAKEMQSKEAEYLTYKKNASEMQESVKFPEKYRQRINEIFYKNLDNENKHLLDIIHKNKFF